MLRKCGLIPPSTSMIIKCQYHLPFTSRRIYSSFLSMFTTNQSLSSPNDPDSFLGRVKNWLKRLSDIHTCAGMAGIFDGQGESLLVPWQETVRNHHIHKSLLWRVFLVRCGNHCHGYSAIFHALRLCSHVRFCVRDGHTFSRQGCGLWGPRQGGPPDASRHRHDFQNTIAIN